MNSKMMLLKILSLLCSMTFFACSSTSNQEEHGEAEHAEEEGHNEDEHGESKIVKLTPAALKRSNIQVQPPTSGRLQEMLRIPAQVEFDPNRIAHVSTFVQGQIVDLGPNIGEQVEAKQVLATIQSVGLGQSRASLITARAQLSVAENNFKRQQLLRAEGINSERSLAEAEATVHEARAARDAAQSELKVLGDGGKSG